MKIAVIPARGGSKRIPRKNIRPFFGKPMIAWSIEAAIESGCFDRIIVSTDDEKIADIARHRGAEVPFLRPPELASDQTGTLPVVAHAIDWINTHIGNVDDACCIYATAPFLRSDDLRRGYDLLSGGDVHYAISVCSYAFPIQRALRMTDGSRIEMLHHEHFQSRSQDLEEMYHDAGQFYWGKASAWLDQIPPFGSEAAPVLLPRYRVQDIDTLEDWTCAELLFRALRSRER